MSEEFEKWVSAPPLEYDIDKYSNYGLWPGQYKDACCQLAFEAWQHQQSKLDAQEKELAALRGFAESVLRYTISQRTRQDAVTFGLCDHSRKPTRILTGNSEQG